MENFKKIDLHMHTTISDGTDEPEEIVQKVRESGIDLFSVTDHDAIKCSRIVPEYLTEDGPSFITGVEFSCRDELGKYHILGYGYDPENDVINRVVDLGHSFRMEKVKRRLEFLRNEYGIEFPRWELWELLHQENPGKPHIGNLMVKYGYAESREEAIKEYIDKYKAPTYYVRPEDAIRGILEAGGIPVLAHPTYGSGEQIIVGDEMDERLRRLMGFGIKGVEAFYSGFTAKIRKEMLDFAEKYDLYVTAGSDYHGNNKLVPIGDNWLDTVDVWPRGLERFLEDVNVINDLRQR